MTEKERYQTNVEAQLNEWQAGIGKLKDKFDKAGVKGNLDYEQQFKRLARGLEEVQQKFQQLQEANEEQGAKFKKELDRMLVSWRSSFEQIQAEILKTD
ncbi:MAG: hypothetical protein L6R45_31525 [Anaerolineae bacterium]|nr:hypothetical protein [Anaerolineae bacterium]